MTNTQNLQSEINAWERRLQILKEKRAKLGISAEPSIDLEIEEIEVKLQELQAKLQQSFEINNNDLSEAETHLISQNSQEDIDNARKNYEAAYAAFLEASHSANKLRERYSELYHSHQTKLNHHQLEAGGLRAEALPPKAD